MKGDKAEVSTLSKQQAWALACLQDNNDFWVWQGGRYWLWGNNETPQYCDYPTIDNLRRMGLLEYVNMTAVETLRITDKGLRALKEKEQTE